MRVAPDLEQNQHCDQTLAWEGRAGCTQSELDSSTGSDCDKILNRPWPDCYVCHSLHKCIPCLLIAGSLFDLNDMTLAVKDTNLVQAFYVDINELTMLMLMLIC